jgi:hypothetical protein
MGDLRLAYEQRDGRNLVFALLPSGQAVWGMDAATRQEWWYAPELADRVLPDLRAALAVPRQAPSGAPASGPGADLALHRPGHAVLAAIEDQHRSATNSVIDGMPGTLDDGIVSWCVGYVGETQVGTELARLGPAWRTLHGVPVGTAGSDIDHVVIGPPGVFTINTKHHAGVNVDVKGDSIFVGRDYQHYVRNARKEAVRAQAAVSDSTVPVRAVITTVGARLRVKQAPQDVMVLDSAALVPWLSSQPAVLTDADVQRLFEHLRWSGRWTESLPPAAAAPWVDGFARQMATEQAVAKMARRRGSRTAAAGGPPPRPTATRRASARPPGRARPRSGGISVRRELVRLALGILFFAFMVTAGPAILNGIASVLTPKVPTPSPRAVAGASCTSRGAEAVSPTGATLVCAPGQGSTALVWRTPKS